MTDETTIDEYRIDDDIHEDAEHEESHDDLIDDGSDSDEGDLFTEEKAQERTFKQEDVDRIASDRARRERDRASREYADEIARLRQQLSSHQQQNNQEPMTEEQQVKEFLKQSVASELAKERAADNQRRLSTKLETELKSAMKEYPDYEETVSKLTTPSPEAIGAVCEKTDMARFVYHAAKHHCEEWNAITRIDNPFSQAMALSELKAKMQTEARMRAEQRKGKASTARVVGGISDSRSNMTDDAIFNLTPAQQRRQAEARILKR